MQPKISLETTIKDCYFGAFNQDIPNGEIKIQDLIKLTGEQAAKEYGYKYSLLKEIVLVLASCNLYFSDCNETMRSDIHSYIQAIRPKHLSLTIEELDFSVRTFNCLKRAGIETVEDLTNRTYEDMIKVRNLGKRSLEEIIEKLDSLGVSLKEDEE